MATLEHVMKVVAELQGNARVSDTVFLYNLHNTVEDYMPFCEDCGDWHFESETHSAIYHTRADGTGYYA